MTNLDNNWGDGLKMYMTNYTINSFQKDYPKGGSFCRSNALAFPRFPITIYENIIDEQGNKPDFDSYDCQKVPNLRLSKEFVLEDGCNRVAIFKTCPGDSLHEVRDGQVFQRIPKTLSILSQNGCGS